MKTSWLLAAGSLLAAHDKGAFLIALTLTATIDDCIFVHTHFENLFVGITAPFYDSLWDLAARFLYRRALVVLSCLHVEPS